MAHGKNLKRRGKVKVSRKQKNTLYFKSKNFTSPEIQKQWNPKKTVRQNYERLGLNPNPNDVQSLREADALGKGEDINDEKRVEWFDIPESDNLRGSKRGLIMSEEEQLYLKTLMQKHGENYEAMARDIKANKQQWTESKLRRRCTRLLMLPNQS